jgi:hypothetical protein
MPPTPPADSERVGDFMHNLIEQIGVTSPKFVFVCHLNSTMAERLAAIPHAIVDNKRVFVMPNATGIRFMEIVTVGSTGQPLSQRVGNNPDNWMMAEFFNDNTFKLYTSIAMPESK